VKEKDTSETTAESIPEEPKPEAKSQ